MTDVIDLDEPSTWPPMAREHAEYWASVLKDRDGLVSDLDVDENEPTLVELLDGRPVKAFHCTRLLDHEVEDIRTKGLAVLNGELIDRRLRDAFEAGYFNENMRELLSHTAIRDDSAGRRQGQTCGVIGRQVFETHADDLRPLLAMWGGEAINMDVADGAIRSLIKNIGRPSIVQYRFDPTPQGNPWPLINPDVRKLFVGLFIGLDTHASVHYDGPISATDIEEVWHPGHPMYDRFPNLPR